MDRASFLYYYNSMGLTVVSTTTFKNTMLYAPLGVVVAVSKTGSLLEYY
jgi:hypothetical protein